MPLAGIIISRVICLARFQGVQDVQDIPRATTRDCPYMQINIVGAIPRASPYVVYLFLEVALLTILLVKSIGCHCQFSR